MASGHFFLKIRVSSLQIYSRYLFLAKIWLVEEAFFFEKTDDDDILDLPDDLESEILSRVPAKSLCRLTTTWKRWYALFIDPRFVEKNKKLCKAVKESMLLINHEVYSIGGDLHSCSVEPSIEFTSKLRSLKGSEDLGFSQLYHCDGLMLSSNEGNPCTGQRRNIKPRTCYQRNDRYALGYTTSSSSDCSHSYKILRYWYYRNKKKVWVSACEIYELSSDSWRVLDSFPLNYFVYFSGVSLKGNTYFLAGDNETDAFLRTKFDFTTERFVRLPLPFQSFERVDNNVLSVVRDEKLSVLHIDGRSNVMRSDQ
ncbi:hypothetical protein Bca4012_098897 [Brassica carinata]|uniref:BnaCnng21390D protein n=2 Tax=Brassica TaxID=3705 RepID=A0A078IPL5_BRANA|nr:BnaCnng21390D [Brassica napus]